MTFVTCYTRGYCYNDCILIEENEMKAHFLLAAKIIGIVAALIVAFVVIGIIWWLVDHPGLHLFEDGSWYIFHRLFISGCYPHAACNIGR